jgi:citrate lyase subunit beta/citryl-CoA lyase
MPTLVHPDSALFMGEKTFPILPVCEHFAGSEKLIKKALQLQAQLGPIFDITCDCEDGAQAGNEIEHARMVAELVRTAANPSGRIGVRIHDVSHSSWRSDVDIVVGRAASGLAYVTIPKSTSVAGARECIAYIQQVARSAGRTAPLPVHILVETHAALRHVYELAELPHVEVLDFGLMDFVSSHHGAIGADSLRSPGQFDHRLLARAKTDVVAAALAAGVVPAHNVCLTLTDAATIRGDALRAFTEFGFQRMWSIHPAQIEPIVATMRPGLDEVEDAVQILVAAQDNQWGPIKFKGELHDRATYRYFWALLKRANATRCPLPEIAGHRFFS